MLRARKGINLHNLQNSKENLTQFNCGQYIKGAKPLQKVIEGGKLEAIIWAKMATTKFTNVAKQKRKPHL